MNLFTRLLPEERRARMARQAYGRAVRRYLAPFRQSYCGRRFLLRSKRGMYVSKVTQIDDDGMVLLRCRQQLQPRLRYILVLPLREFLLVVDNGRLAPC